MLALIQEAMKKSEDFHQRMSYWVHRRNRAPETGWVLLRLIEILGYDRVEEGLKAAKNGGEIGESSNGEISTGESGTPQGD